MTQDCTSQIERFSDLLGSLYQAPLQAGRSEEAWQPWLAQLRISLECNYTVLILRPPSAVDAGIHITNGPGYDPGNDIYSAGLYAQDPFVNLPPDRVVALSEYVDQETLRASEFYQICIKPADTFHILGVDLAAEEGLQAGLRLCRPEKAKPFNSEEREAVERLIPHLKRALQLYRRLNHIELERSLYAGALTQLSVATLLLDGELRILGANPIAENLLSEQDGVRRLEGCLSLARRRDNQRLKDLVGQACAASQSGAPALVSAMPVERPSGRAPLGLVVRPLAEGGNGDDQPAVSVFISDPEHPTEASSDVLCQLFGLTRAEARLALQLANGLSLEQAAAELGITRNTGRAHLRAIFTKTGVSQQTQLVSLILKSAANLT